MDDRINNDHFVFDIYRITIPHSYENYRNIKPNIMNNTQWNKPLNNTDTPEVVSYISLRRWVGVLGIALPIVLYAGYKLVNSCTTLPPSISHYYYSNMGTYFTGTLCAVALFMYCYNGYDRLDKLSTNFASVCALIVAFFPTNIVNHSNDVVTWCNTQKLPLDTIRNSMHYTGAALLFSTFAFISFFLFTKSKHISANRTANKKARNILYKICGAIIVLCIVAIPLSNFPASTFTFETIALFAFGFSWLIKGETLLKD